MKKIFFGLLSVLILTLFACNSNDKMPDLQKQNGEALKTIKIDCNLQVASLRSVPIVGSYSDPSNLNSRKVSIDWGNDTWDNGANRPKLIVTVGDNVYEVPNGNYDYKKSSGQGASSVHIAYDLKYATDADKVNFYLVDKATAVDLNAKTIDFTNQNGTELKPLNANGVEKPKFNFIFASKTTISDIKTQMTQSGKMALSFSPAGTIVLFDATVISGKTTTLKFTTNCFDISGKIDMISGMGKNNVTTDVKHDFTAKRGDQNKSIYGLYVLGRNVGSGKISLGEYDGTIYSDRVFNITKNFFTSFDKKFVNLNMLPRESEREYFETEWSGSDKIKIDMIQGNDVFARYREKGSDNWNEIRVNTDTGKGSLEISNLNQTKIYELRLFGVYSLIVTQGQANTTIKKVTHWGTTRWASLYMAFKNCSELDVTADDAPNLSTGTVNLLQAFFNCKNLKGNEAMKHWNTATVTNTSEMFAGCEKFNLDISGWDVSNVTNMRSMFSGAKLFNQNLNNWIVSKVTNMGNMFRETAFNQPLDNWDVSKVTAMDNMFISSKFDQDISGWNVSNVTTMKSMFENTPFNKPLNAWATKVSKVTDMQRMFQDAKYFNQPLNMWTPKSCTTMFQMFNGAIAFDQNISSWSVPDGTLKAGVVHDSLMFGSGCPLENQPQKQPRFQ